MQNAWFIAVFLSFFVNFLLVMGTNRLAGYPSGWKKAMLAGLIGGLHAGGCLIKGFGFLGQTHWRIIMLAVMSFAAFGWSSGAVKRGALLTLLHLALDGIACGGLWPGLLAVAAVWLLCNLNDSGGEGKRSLLDVTITHGEKTLTLPALLDTGNTLRDPISGKGVVVVDSDAAKELLGLELPALNHPVETYAMKYQSGFRLIPYSSVGQPAGMLLGLKADSIQINGKKTNLVVAFAPHRIGRGEAYRALAGGGVL